MERYITVLQSKSMKILKVYKPCVKKYPHISSCVAFKVIMVLHNCLHFWYQGIKKPFLYASLEIAVNTAKELIVLIP